jgi:ABC-type Fe3+-hydroxamate transport system substrate-binding protein
LLYNKTHYILLTMIGNTPKLTRALLRKAAGVVLETECGYRVEVDEIRQGVAQGARLIAIKGAQTLRVAVRTSLSRKIRLMRRDDGAWRTIPDVDLVVVAVPADRKSTAIEVLGFKPDDIIKSFDAALESLETKRDAGFPVVVALDEKTRRGVAAAGLKTKAIWKYFLSLDAPALGEATKAETGAEFINRVKREFAERNGVNVSMVVVEFRLVA